MSTVLEKGKKAVYINAGNDIQNPDGFTIKTKGKNIYIEGGIQKRLYLWRSNLARKIFGLSLLQSDL